jgi:dTDP-4-dehydrorhamnose reductase
MTIIVFGANGQLGQSCRKVFEAQDLECLYLDRVSCDVESFSDLEATFEKYQPSFVVNCTAYTAVDKAEVDKECAESLNVTAVRNISFLCAKYSSHLVHISTDYVFDGTKKSFYLPSDPVCPVSVYGETKKNGEEEIISSGCAYTIIRTAWVFSEFGNNFLKTMLRLSDKTELNIVGDQIGTPTYAPDLASAILSLYLYSKSNTLESEILHFSGDVAVSWWSFASEIFRRLSIHQHKDIPVINSIASVDYPTPARRPAFSVLDSSGFKKYNVQPSNWASGIDQALSNIY